MQSLRNSFGTLSALSLSIGRRCLESKCPWWTIMVAHRSSRHNFCSFPYFNGAGCLKRKRRHDQCLLPNGSSKMTGLWIWCLPKHRLRRKCDIPREGKKRRARSSRACGDKLALWTS